MTVANDSVDIIAESADRIAAENDSPATGRKETAPAKRKRRRKKTPSPPETQFTNQTLSEKQLTHESTHIQTQDASSDLRQELEQKESVIQALTNQLEQAAERLDRIHRTGSDRQIRGPQLPDEFLGQQQEMLEELQLAIRQMEESQPATMLERIEQEVCGVRDMVSDFVHGTITPNSVAHRTESTQTDGGEEPSLAAALSQAFGGPAAQPERTAPHAEQPEPADENSVEEHNGVDGLSSATMSLLRSLTPGSASIGPAKSKQSELDAPLGVEDDPSLIDLKPIDLESADREELVQGIEDREAMVSILIHKLRAAKRRSQPIGHWSEIGNVPEEMGERLQELEQRLDETARLAELDLSLERARLARDASRLHTLEQQLRGREQAMAVTSQDEKDGTTKVNRRWLRFVGRSRD